MPEFKLVWDLMDSDTKKGFIKMAKEVEKNNPEAAVLKKLIGM